MHGTMNIKLVIVVSVETSLIDRIKRHFLETWHNCRSSCTKNRH